jgi:hypothetical protein
MILRSSAASVVPHNRLGFAVQLCYLRFPGQAMTFETKPPAELLTCVAQQVGVDPNVWTETLAAAGGKPLADQSHGLSRKQGGLVAKPLKPVAR